MGGQRRAPHHPPHIARPCTDARPSCLQILATLLPTEHLAMLRLSCSLYTPIQPCVSCLAASQVNMRSKWLGPGQGRYQVQTLIIGGDYQAAVQGHCEAPDGRAHLWHQLAAAGIGCQVPDPDVPMLVACASHFGRISERDTLDNLGGAPYSFRTG